MSDKETRVGEDIYVLSEGRVYVRKGGLLVWSAYWENDSDADIPWDELIDAWGPP